MTAMTPAQVLRAAADWFAEDPDRWGRDNYLDPKTGCRCALGAIAVAVDPNDEDGDPFRLYALHPNERMPAITAAGTLYDYVTSEYHADPSGLGVPYVVGSWNDRPERAVTDVIAALRAAADRAEQVTQ